MTSPVKLKAMIPVFRIILYITSSAFAICAIVALIYSESSLPFIIPSAGALLIALASLLLKSGSVDDVQITRKDAYLMVTLAWLSMSLLGTIPYLLSGSVRGFTNCLFESVSGFTTTGSSILTDIEALPYSILFWRSLTHWIGGIGIIVLVIVVMPAFRMGGYHLFTLESSLQEKIRPRIKSAGYRLLVIYLILTFTEVILLMAGNMNLFESLCHAFGTVATGGFSPKNSSIGGYSAYIQYIVMIFMLLSGTNFVIHYWLLKGYFAKASANEEVRFFYLIILTVGAVITGSLYLTGSYSSFSLAFRESYFQTISIITCTGYATADYLLWPNFAIALIFLSMFLGGSTGSTSGGIKISRHIIVFKNIRRTFRKMVESRAVIAIKLNQKSVHGETNSLILSFVLAYFFLFLFSTLLLAAFGSDISTSAGAAATAMGGIGPGIGDVGPASNFAAMPVPSKYLLSFLMIAGRLEIFPIIILLTPGFWKD